MYRGLILGLFVVLSKENRLAVWGGVILSAGLWSVQHYTQWEPAYAGHRLAFLLVDGCVFGWIAHRYSVGTGILCHMLCNTVNYPITFLLFCILGS